VSLQFDAEELKSTTMSFTHLHLHTEYSFLDGLVRIDSLIEHLKEYDMQSCAITDHGNLYGAYKFYSALKQEDMKPVLGCEIYIAPRKLEQKEYGVDNKYYHAVLLAKNFEGYQNLLKIVSKGHIDGFYYKPRVDYEFLKQHSKGLIMLSGCLTGIISKPISEGDLKLAKKNLEKYLELYGKDFYIEIQRNGMEEQDRVNEELVNLSNAYKIPIVGTCDAHYLEKGDAEIQEILWCIRDGKTIDDPTRKQLETDEFYVKSPEEMKELFKDIPEAIENTQKIVDSIEDFSIEFERVEPHYLDLPEGKTPFEHLRDLTYQGCEEKYDEVTKELKERIEYELEVINNKGYCDYFLVMMDFVLFCRRNNIVVGMRGSGCGSVVAYCIGITHIEPIGWDLVFERFLNPERESPPDFDIDIADKRREEVIQYAIEKYGEDNVKQIATFNKLQTRQAIRDVSRVMNIDLETADELSKMVEVVFGKAKDIDYMMENNAEFRGIVESSTDLQRMTSIVKKISGMCRGISTHACGAVITPEPVVNYVPIQRDAHGGGIGMSQYEMNDLEFTGLMKFDFLGLRNLNVIGTTVEKIKENRGEEIDLLNIDIYDKKAFELIRSGNTTGLFQLESDGMKKTIKMIKPKSLEEISYVIAAYRPGPMQFIPEYVDVQEGKKEPEYLFPELKNIIEVTNGVITYQEQVIRIAVDIAGYSMGSADILRRAMGKKKMDVMNAEKPKFISGAQEQGFDKKSVEAIWDKLVQFANYGFNKAHSASYALVAYWTAYLKANYPTEFMASLLEGDLDNFDRIIIDLEECGRMGIKVSAPDINKSYEKFTIEGDNKIRFGLAAIKNVGEEVVHSIVEEREERGEFLNFDDFLYRMVERNLNIKTVEYLIKVGAFDKFGERGALLSVLESLFNKYKDKREQAKLGQYDLFAKDNTIETHIKTPSTLPKVQETPIFEKLSWEKELVGVYFSSHPLDPLERFIQENDIVRVKDLREKEDGYKVAMVALISNIRKLTTKKGDQMAVLSVEDKTGSMEVVVFPNKYKDFKHLFKEGIPMGIIGRLNTRDDNFSVILERIKEIDLNKHADNFEGISFKVGDEHTQEDLEELKRIITQNSGQYSVRIIINKNNENKIMNLNHKVDKNQEILKYIEKFS